MAAKPIGVKAQLLRERAERCFQLAKGAARAEDAELLNEIGREYLDMAEKLEAAIRRAMRKRSRNDNGSS